MLDVLARSDDGVSDSATLNDLVAHAEIVLRSAAPGRARVIAAIEEVVRAAPHTAFAFDSTSLATLQAGDHSSQAGRFRLASVGELRLEAAARARQSGARGRLRLWVIDGGAAPTDIGSFQAHGGDGTLFQVASQFNCLEAPGPFLTSVARYLNDSTQGPRAAISAFPGTLLRHYAAPDGRGGRFVQEDGGRQLDLLEEICDPALGRVRNGYLMAHEIRNARAFVSALETRFEAIRVGVHDDVEVLFGYDWGGVVTASPAPRIAQVFTSTLAGGGYGSVDGPLIDVCRQLLRAAYLGTLLSAVALDRTRVVLTLIGGGAFGNPASLIWEAIGWAMDQVAPLVSRDLTVVVNGRDLDAQLRREVLLSTVRRHGGALLSWRRCGPPSIDR